MSATKRKALAEVLPLYAPPRPIPPGTVLEIGCGNGEAIVALAEANPSARYVAVDVHLAGLALLSLALREKQIANVGIVNGDALLVLREDVVDGSLGGVLVFFPDPWPKARQRHRRLVQARFAGLLARRLAPGAIVHVATDSDMYAAQVREVFGADARFRPVAAPPRPTTKYERHGRQAGRAITDIAYERVRGGAR